VSAVVRAGCAAAALFAAFATGCGGHGRAPGTIVFESDRSGRAAFYAVREYVFAPASHAQRTIRLLGLASDNVPSWSPDDERLAFETDHGDVVALNVKSGVRHRIAGGSNGFAVAWSPDGKRVLFVGDSSDALYTAPARGGKRMRLLRFLETSIQVRYCSGRRTGSGSRSSTLVTSPRSCTWFAPAEPASA
jgi:Tol biopolymer transport system component